MNVSVVMATYNGCRFLSPQISSILSQLSEFDELIIVDDASTDETLEAISSFGDDRIKIFRNSVNLGHVQTFSRAISLANFDFIFMADQDDIWTDGRLAKMKNALLQEDCWVVATNTSFIDTNGKPIAKTQEGVTSHTSTNYFGNVFGIYAGRPHYWGCAMAIKRQIVPIIIPIPKFVESHDLWIALAGNLIRKNLHLNFISLLRRIHDTNASVVNRSLYHKIYSRFIFSLSALVILARFARLHFLKPLYRQ